MRTANLIRRLLHRRVQLTVLSASAFICFVAGLALISQVFLKLDEYGSANRDNIQWTVSKLEVDYTKFVAAVDSLAYNGTDSIPDLHQRFDTFYSRAHTLKNARSYRDTLRSTSAQPVIDGICARLEKLVTLIDQDETAILNSQGALAETSQDLAAPIRRLAALGVAFDVQRREEQRTALTDKLTELAALSALMLATLGALLALFWQLYRRYRRRAMQNRITLNRLNTILRTSQDAILVVCPSGQILEGNGAADAIFALSLPGEDPIDISQILFKPDETGNLQPVPGEKLAASCANGPNLCTRLTARDKKGRTFPIELSANMASRSGDNVCVCFIRDISHRVAAESEMHAARDKALAGERAKARFLGMISHEMRTPLNGILGALDLLEDTPLTPEQARYAQIMQSSGQLVLNQINDALDITQADDGRLSVVNETFDLDALLDELLQSQQPDAIAQGNTLKILRSVTPLGQVQGDRNRLHQVLLNLLSNAIKFTRDGEITVEVTRLNGPGDDIEFQISDTGIGIAEEDLPRIFDDFVRLEEHNAPSVDGTGLGLGIVRHLITLMGGTIGAESVRHEGSLFWARVPLPRAIDTISPASDPGTQRHPAKALNVLVVEDNPTSRFVLNEMLHKDGHSVELTENGADGVAAAGRKAFDLILMDINMPGIDGIEATRQIRAGNGPSADARIVALTAHFRPEHNDRIRGTRIDAICTKPLRRAALRDILAGDTIRNRPSAAQTGVDAQVLDQLFAVLPKQNLASVLGYFLSEGQQFIDALTSLSTEPRQKQAERLHHFAGSAATFGAVALQTALCRAEAAALASDDKALSEELAALPGLWQDTMGEIDQRRRAA